LSRGDTKAAVGTPALVREYLFSPHTPDELVTRCAGRVQRESFRALYVDSLFANLPRPQRVTMPLLVLGAEHDGIFTHEEVHATARAYGTAAEIFPGMGHNMMVEPGWRDVAERIAVWLGSNLTPRRS
jgi:pimeloyl-ACP methyl ester carboxylesterase